MKTLLAIIGFAALAPGVHASSTNTPPPVRPSVCDGRLTTESGVAVSSSDRTAQSTLYFTPYQGSNIAVYNGTFWVLYTFTERSLVLSSLTSGKNYDVFIYDNAGTLTLELSAAWTDDTTRADALTQQDGVFVKSTATTRRYLGTIRTTGTTTTEDSGGGVTTQVGGKRFVWNMNNRVRRFMAVIDTASWNYSTATWRQADAAAGNKVEYVCGQSVTLRSEAVSSGQLNGQSGNASAVGIGIDSTTTPSGVASVAYSPLGGQDLIQGMRAAYVGAPSLGYHSVVWIESGGNGSNPVFRSGFVSGTNSGLTAEVEN